MQDEYKGFMLTGFGAIVTTFLFYRIDYPIINETVTCIISIGLGLLFCSLYAFRGIGIIAKLLTGFIVSYVAGMPIYWKLSRWVIPKNYQMLVVWLLLIFIALIFDAFLWTYTEDTILGGEVDLLSLPLVGAIIKPFKRWSKKCQQDRYSKKTVPDRKRTKSLDSVLVKEENEKLRMKNSTLELENKRLQNRIDLLELERKAQMCKFFDDNSMEVIFNDVDSEIRKKRFRKLSQIFHPDSEIGDAEIFRMIKEAYQNVENS